MTSTHFILLCSIYVLAIVIFFTQFIYISIKYDKESRRILNNYADANTLRLIHCRESSIGGPFALTRGRTQRVYRITIIDEQNQNRQGWACVRPFPYLKLAPGEELQFIWDK